MLGVGEGVVPLDASSFGDTKSASSCGGSKPAASCGDSTSAFLLEAQAPTGAGDSFAGGFLGYIAKQGNTEPDTLRRAVIYGSTLASFCVEGIGLSQACVNQAAKFTITSMSEQGVQFDDGGDNQTPSPPRRCRCRSSSATRR